MPPSDGCSMRAVLGSADSPAWIGEWLGVQMFFGNYDADANRRLLSEAGFELLIDEVIETVEPEGRVNFLWIAAAGSCKPVLPISALNVSSAHRAVMSGRACTHRRATGSSHRSACVNVPRRD
jgi:hypothetical protein